MLPVIEETRALREQVRAWRSEGLRVGFVPTMGNLHAGHLSLVEHCAQQADRIVVSIFINPTQFGPNEDFERYPRTLDEDVEKLAGVPADVVFAPGVEQIYPGGTENATFIHVPGVSDILCGASRPGHFDGVATVVTTLFNLVQPDVAAFGEKDYQQLAVIETLVRDLAIPVTILRVPIMREADGLAMSSRNQYLTRDERQRASGMYAALCDAALQLREGRDPGDVIERAVAALIAAGFEPDYFEVRDAQTLAEPSRADQSLVVLAAARLGQTRLIDNLSVRKPPPQ